MPEITRAQAKAIQDAFGSCTTLYECWTIDEIIKEIRPYEGTISEWLDIQLTVEGVHIERGDDAACHQQESGEYPPDHHAKVVEGGNVFLNSLKERVSTLRKQHNW
jgi:hypothetical protein